MKQAFAIMHYFPRGTRKQYEASLAAVHPGRKRLPKGQIVHVAGPVAGGGWVIVAVHNSKKSWIAFRNKILVPTMKKGIKGGFKSLPKETSFKVHNLQK
jgi:hypothetical protein